MARTRGLWCAAAILASLAIHGIARACSCGPYINVLSRGESPPANVLIALGNCATDLPADALRVWVDGLPAAFVDAGLEAGRYATFVRIEPTPAEGQTVVIDGCGQGDCVPAWPIMEWVAGPVDDTPPVASVSGIATSVLEAVPNDGLACPPFEPRIVVELDDLMADGDVAAFRIEQILDGVVIDGSWAGWDVGLVPFPTLSIFTQTTEYSCVRAFAVDRAGNETLLGPEDCTVTEAADDTGPEADDDLEPSGCGCASGSADPRSALLFALVLGLRRRPR